MKLPRNHAHRHELHNELHARPSARIRVPALVTYVAVLNEHLPVDDEWRLLQTLPGHQGLAREALNGSFLRLRCDQFMVKWERHSEFSRFSITQTLDDGCGLGAAEPDLAANFPLPQDWLARLPGETICAIQLALTVHPLEPEHDFVRHARAWLGTEMIIAARIGSGYAAVATDYRIRDDGFVRFIAVADALTESRAGRVSQRILELETYRMLALRGYPVARSMSGDLRAAEQALAGLTGSIDNRMEPDGELLHRLVSLAAQIEGKIAEQTFRFSATRAYYALVQGRIEALREVRIPGVQTIGEFLDRRLAPAMATVDASARRLADLSERIARTSALIRTRADIVREEQNQRLFEKLTQGQQTQLRLQQTVEGLSIAAISYYVVGLLGYGFKAAKAAGWLALDSDLALGLAIPVVLAVVAYLMHRVRRTLSG